MPDTPNIALLRQVNADLTAHVAELGAEQLRQPSACAGWDVSQVLGHLGAAVEGIMATVEAAAAGAEAPAPQLGESMRARWNTMTPEDKRDGVLDRTAALLALLESADPDLRVSLRFSPVPLSADQLAGFLLIELAFHAWDVRVPFEPDAQLFPPAVPVLAQLISGFMGRMTAAGKIDGAPVLRVELADPAQSFGLVLGDPLERVDPPADAAAVVRGNSADWLLLVMGRSGARPLAVSGSVGLDDLRQVFAGV